MYIYCYSVIIISDSVGGLGKANSVVAKVKLSVVWTNEDVSEDPDGSHGGRDVHAHEAGETDLLPHLGDLHDVVLGLQGELHAAECEGDVREAGQSGAVYDVLSPDHGRSSESLVDSGHLVNWTRDQGGASVGDGLAAALAEASLDRGVLL